MLPGRSAPASYPPRGKQGREQDYSPRSVCQQQEAEGCRRGSEEALSRSRQQRQHQGVRPVRQQQQRRGIGGPRG